jgi:hypothetical protein
VVDIRTEQGIPDIEVIVRPQDNICGDDTTCTASDGSFEACFYRFPILSLDVTHNDVDGTTNGSHTDRSEQLTLSESDRKDTGAWTRVISKSGLMLTMEPETEETEQ